MVEGRVSVVIPARNERFLVPTVADLRAKARGDVEIIVIHDGGWANPPIPDDLRVKQLHFGEARGMRHAINSALASEHIASGEFILKADAHTMWDEGFDLKLKADYHEDNWILIPRRYPLDPEKWAFEERTDNKYPVDYHFLSEPHGKHGDSVPGVHGSPWTARREARKHIEIDEEMASQGSAWFVSRKCWNWLGPQDESLYGKFWFENQEMSLKAWMRGGAQMITKRTWYSHLFKGARWGRMYSTRGMGHEAATAFTSWFWLTNQPLAGRVRNFEWLISRFEPVPTWDDVDAILARARAELKNPYQVAA